MMMKKNDKTYVCPRCSYPLVPVHARDGGRRRIIALTCPEPYCDHMQLVTRQEAKSLRQTEENAPMYNRAN